MMQPSLIDLHCDTVYEMYMQAKRMIRLPLAISLQELPTHIYGHYLQIAAIWSDQGLSDDEAYDQFCKIIAFMKSASFRHPNIEIFEHFHSPDRLLSTSTNQLILAVEDARLLSGNLQRLENLYSVGVRFLTMLWKGTSCIGGAYDTDVGLTPFGVQTVRKCVELGIIPDLSHASQRSARDILEQANGSPVVASHSDSFTVYPHPRNLTDDLFRSVHQSEGLVGINLYTEHLGCDILVGSDIEIVLRHIEHFLSLDGEDVICFGCDFDGAKTPATLQHPTDLSLLAEAMTKSGYSDTLIAKLFWKNAERFILKNIFNIS